MSNLEIRLLDQNEYHLLNDFCEEHNLPMLSPEWSKVVVALDQEKVVGIMVAQMQIHVEPIWISKKYRNGFTAKKLSTELDGYLDTLAYKSEKKISTWCQPTNSAARKICTSNDYIECRDPLFTKTYDGSKVAGLFDVLDNQSIDSV